MSKTSKIKEVVAKTDISKIADYSQKYPNSKTLRQIARYSKRVLDSEKEEEIFRLSVKLAYDFDKIVNMSKYVEKEEEKIF